MKPKLAIFDMDGLIIDSEPFWDKAESQVLINSGLPVHQYDSVHTTGFRIADTVSFWAEACNLTEPNSVIENRIVDSINSMICERGVLLPGIAELMASLKRNNVNMCIASSSPVKLIDTVIDKFGLKEYILQRFSAEDCEYGKPNPEIFIHVMKEFGVVPEDTVIFEDSVSGVIAAKSARATCIAIPETLKLEDQRYSIADHVCVDGHEALKVMGREYLDQTSLGR